MNLLIPKPITQVIEANRYCINLDNPYSKALKQVERVALAAVAAYGLQQIALMYGTKYAVGALVLGSVGLSATVGATVVAGGLYYLAAQKAAIIGGASFTVGGAVAAMVLYQLGNIAYTMGENTSCGIIDSALFEPERDDEAEAMAIAFAILGVERQEFPDIGLSTLPPFVATLLNANKEFIHSKNPLSKIVGHVEVAALAALGAYGLYQMSLVYSLPVVAATFVLGSGVLSGLAGGTMLAGAIYYATAQKVAVLAAGGITPAAVAVGVAGYVVGNFVLSGLTHESGILDSLFFSSILL